MHTSAHRATRAQRQRDYDRERGSATARGYDSRWRGYARNYLKQNPLCVHCELRGDTKASECVDHKRPVSGPADPGFWDPDNHQALCWSCHSVKTNREDGGFGNPARGPRGGGIF